MHMTSFRTLALFLPLALAACTTNVVGGADTGNGTGTAPTPTNDGAGGSAPTPTDDGTGGSAPSQGTNPAQGTAIAIFDAQMGDDGPPGAGGASTAGSALYLIVGSPAPTCGDPLTIPPTCSNSVELQIWIPSASQQKGTYSFGSPASGVTALSYQFFAASGPGESGDCGGGGGPLEQGSLDIVSIDDTEVTFTLSGTVADGTYTAPHCP